MSPRTASADVKRT